MEAKQKKIISILHDENGETVPILQLPIVQNRLTDLFNRLEEEFKRQFNEFLVVVDDNPPNVTVSDQISYEDTIKFFKEYFLDEVLQEAVEMALMEQAEKYNVLDNIIYILSKETLLDAIHGTPMISAISAVIKRLPCKEPRDKDIHDSIVLSFKKNFYGDDFLKYI